MRRFAGRRVNAVSRRLSQHGLWAMTLLRLLPIAPFSVVNLVAGASEMRLRDFLLGSLLGMLPGHRADDRCSAIGSAPGCAGRTPPIWRSWSGLTLAVVAAGPAARPVGAGAGARDERDLARSRATTSMPVAGWDGRQDVGRVAAVLREIDADVVGLQEVESRHGRSAIDQAEALGEALGMALHRGPAPARPTAAGTATPC